MWRAHPASVAPRRTRDPGACARTAASRLSRRRLLKLNCGGWRAGLTARIQAGRGVVIAGGSGGWPPAERVSATRRRPVACSAACRRIPIASSRRDRGDGGVGDLPACRLTLRPSDAALRRWRGLGSIDGACIQRRLRAVARGMQSEIFRSGRDPKTVRTVNLPARGAEGAGGARVSSIVSFSRLGQILHPGIDLRIRTPSGRHQFGFGPGYQLGHGARSGSWRPTLPSRDGRARGASISGDDGWRGGAVLAVSVPQQVFNATTRRCGIWFRSDRAFQCSSGSGRASRRLGAILKRR